VGPFPFIESKNRREVKSVKNVGQTPFYNLVERLDRDNIIKESTTRKRVVGGF
jgi:hypothetical protein